MNRRATLMAFMGKSFPLVHSHDYSQPPHSNCDSRMTSLAFPGSAIGGSANRRFGLPDHAAAQDAAGDGAVHDPGFAGSRSRPAGGRNAPAHSAEGWPRPGRKPPAARRRRPRRARAGRPRGPASCRRRAGCQGWGRWRGGRRAEQAAGGQQAAEQERVVVFSWSILESGARMRRPRRALWGRSVAERRRGGRRRRHPAGARLLSDRAAPRGLQPSAMRLAKWASASSTWSTRIRHRSPGCRRAKRRVDGDELAADLVDVAGALGACRPWRSSAITSPSARPRWHCVLVQHARRRRPGPGSRSARGCPSRAGRRRR